MLVCLRKNWLDLNTKKALLLAKNNVYILSLVWYFLNMSNYVDCLCKFEDWMAEWLEYWAAVLNMIFKFQ